jgi:hypothetical protein
LPNFQITVKYDDFREDHIIINNLANNLEAPYQNFLAQSLVKKNELFIYRYHQEDKQRVGGFLQSHSNQTEIAPPA